MEKEISQVRQMANLLINDKTLFERLKSEPETVINEAATKVEETTHPAYYDDRFLYRVAVIVLGTLALLAALGSIILVVNGKTTPEVLVALGSAAVGALVGLFAPAPNTNKG